MGILRAGLMAEGYDREYSNRELIRRIAGYFRPWRGRLLLVMAMVSLLALFAAALPILVARGVGYFAESDQSSTVVGGALVAVVLTLGVLTWAVNWVRRVQTSKLIGDVILYMRTDAFQSVMGHDMSFFDKYQSGRIVSRITSDTDEFGRAAVLVTEIVTQLLQVVLLLAVLFRVDWQLTLLLCAIAPAAFLIAASFQGIARRITRRSQQAVAEVNVSIQEAVTGISVAKNFRREEGIYREFLEVNRQSYELHVRRGFVLALLFPTLTFFSSVGTAALLYFGGVSVLAGAITPGAWFLFINSVDRFWFPMLNLSAFWSQFQAALSATERVSALMDAKPAVVQQGNLPVTSLRGDIRFEDVDQRYDEKEQVLEGFNLHIRSGKSVALVGHTGAGKSSIVKLVTRFYEFQSGRILIDGQDIRTLDLTSYRQRLGIVSQTPFLFAGTVAQCALWSAGSDGRRSRADRAADRRRRLDRDAAGRVGVAGGRTRRTSEHGPAPARGAGAHDCPRPCDLHPG